MAWRLAERNVTVTSGLAAGIDTAAHTAAVEAADGPSRCSVLASPAATHPTTPAWRKTIVEHGALVSQFWPSSGPARWTFPRRNRVTSGISQGTVVIEASQTSGAKMQARLALEHGKRVWLIRSLVTDQAWARTYVADRGAREIGSVDEVIAELEAPEDVRTSAGAVRQLTLDAL
jgi:DNA processing protein